MSCHETQKNLSDYLDDRLSPKDARSLEAHLGACPSCRAALAQLRRLEELLRVTADPPVSDEHLDELWARVEARLDESPALAAPEPAAAYLQDAPVMVARAGASPRWLMPVLVVGGVVTVAAVVLAVNLVLHRSQSGDEGDRLAQRSSQGEAGDMARQGADRACQMGTDLASQDAGGGAASDMASGLGREAMGHDFAGDMAAGDSGDMVAAMAADMAADDAKSADPRGAGGRRRPPVAAGAGGGGRRPASGGGGEARPRPQPADMGSGGGGQLQDLLRQAGGGDMGGGGGGGGGGGMPNRLGPGDIRAGVDRVVGAARACYNRYRVAGTCQVRVVILGSSGRPASVTVLGTFAATPTGRCVEQAFSRATFRRFTSQSQSFVFPLVFR